VGVTSLRGSSTGGVLPGTAVPGFLIPALRAGLGKERWTFRQPEQRDNTASGREPAGNKRQGSPPGAKEGRKLHSLGKTEFES
jgi:hypothetical protein